MGRMPDYDRRTVVITGTSGALGAGVAAAFAAAGATVVGLDRAAPTQIAVVAGGRYEAADLIDDAQGGAPFYDIRQPWAVGPTPGGFAPPRPPAAPHLPELDRHLPL